MSTSLRRLGKYELQEQLGHGGMAEVWKALDTQLQRSPTRQQSRLLLLFELIALLIVLLGGSLGAYFLFSRTGRGTSPPGAIVGHAFYASS
ncbi:MAG TPA: hypothetical protein VEL31_19950, partial [Ktedonobacteraceae bacterium]|nr:hypothetical protein [Ktedonobacteraceae bacterium]